METAGKLIHISWDFSISVLKMTQPIMEQIEKENNITATFTRECLNVNGQIQPFCIC